MKSNKNFKKGGVSIFIVMVVGVLVSIMSASFLRLMFRDQEQASKLDLSQSAYDSAQAGVEDAKRFLRIFRSACSNPSSGLVVFERVTYNCNTMRDAIQSDSCYVLATAGIGNDNSETIIQTTSGAGGASNDASLNQAYTCVKLRMNTADFLGRTNDGSPSVINLRGTAAFNRVRIRWHSRENMTNGNNIALDSLSNPSVRPRIDSRNWRNQNRPAILKAQFYGYVPGVGGSSSIMDTPYPDDGNGASEMLFYPTNSTSALSSNVSNMPTVRRNESSSQATTDYTFTRCSDRMDANSNAYACETTVNIGRSVDPRDVLYLRLTPLMNDSNFRVELLNGNTVVDFAGVQPRVDSTGRANTQLRRVESRIGFNDTSFPVPLFSAQTESNEEPICKDFSVTRLSNSNVNCRNQ